MKNFIRRFFLALGLIPTFSFADAAVSREEMLLQVKQACAQNIPAELLQELDDISIGEEWDTLGNFLLISDEKKALDEKEIQLYFGKAAYSLNCHSLQDFLTHKKAKKLTLTSKPSFLPAKNIARVSLTPSTHYAGQVYLTGSYGTFGNSYSEMNLLYPLFQQSNKVFLGDIRFTKLEDKSYQGSAGLGYRHLFEDMGFIVGLYGFLDQQKSNLNNIFHQWTVGGEFKTERWTARSNYYITTGTSQYNYRDADLFALESAPPYGYESLFVSEAYEKSIGGMDAEIGYEIFNGMSAYGGYFYFNNDAISSAIEGPRFRAEYVLGALNVLPSWTKRLTLEAAWQHDDVRGEIFNIGFKLGLPLGASQTNGLSSRMMEHIRKSESMITQTTYSNFNPVLNADGSIKTFAEIKNEPELDEVLSNPVEPDALIIEGNIVTTHSVNLRDNILMTGGSFEYAPGYFFNLHPEPSSLSGADNDLIVVGKNVTIRDLALNVTGNNNGAPYAAITNNTASVGNLIVYDVQMTGGTVDISVSDGSQDSVITLTNNSVTLADTENMTAANGILIESTGNLGSKVTVNTIDNNTVAIGSSTVPLDNFTGAGINLNVGSSTGNTNSMAIQGITNNTVSLTNTTNSSVNGIQINSQGTQTLSGNISGNTITMSNMENLFHFGSGIFFHSQTNGTQTSTATLSHNTVTFNTISATDYFVLSGIEFDNAATQTLGTTEENTLIFNDVQGNLAIRGILLENNDGLQTLTGDITKNTLTVTVQPGNNINSFYGIDFDSSSPQILQGSLSDNTITVNDITGTGSTAIRGISLGIGNTQTIEGGIINNTIEIGNIAGDATNVSGFDMTHYSGTNKIETGFYGNNIIMQQSTNQAYVFFVNGGTVMLTIGNGATAGSEAIFAQKNQVNSSTASTNNVALSGNGQVTFLP
jgi:hypothetical protein